MTKSAKIRRLLNLKVKPKEIAEKLKVKPNLVYQVAWHAKKAKKPSKILRAVKQMDRKLNNIKPDKKAEAWAKKNPWFGVSKPKTAYALGLHEELVRSGVDAKSDEYWKRVDEGMSASTKPLTTTQKAIAKKLGLTNNQYPTTDLVNHPPHYKAGGIETIDFIEAKDLNYRLGNVVKYVSRAGKKLNSDPVQDLEKAAFYLQREIEARKSA